jgi:hypothetical protein
MIDILTLALTHGLMALALWRLLSRADLDDDGAVPRPKAQPWHRQHHRQHHHGGDGDA